ncbi:lytic transglycosylase domain-containing protein [Pseudoroseicyclus tamaricis]|uniref:Lytic transglycosylase domain-containing protein n=1 Tax=Pseudoroseicyclus tamaricis TaxID=2705421 RepID=A0A6B2JZA4_9RHOB|nr:lytic transglycosylase domain-containing protein [Pseudoroseicyclus tamaricis]NDU99455.1 lytic transglycosylase domain-containing protein [Pseudoroseicyclus tamaricis]
MLRQLCLTACLCLPPALAPAQEAFQSAVPALRDEQWDVAAALARPDGEVAEALITWMRLREGTASFPEYPAFLAAHPTWPGLERLRAEGERLISPGTQPAEVAAYFADEAPQTGEGVARYAEALIALGRGVEAEAVLMEGWVGLGLDEEGEAALLQSFGEELTPLHPARVEAMLWRWRTRDAERLLPFLSQSERALAEARIALIRGEGDAAEKIAAVPADLAGHPGLAVDRMNRAADEGDYTQAIAIMSAQSGSAAELGQPFRWASWRASLARWLMRDGRPQEAYDLASSHHLEADGTLYADLEWLAGFIALTDLNDPALADGHFRAFLASVDGPVSLSRGHYWRGRALEAAGDGAGSTAEYQAAAEFQTAYYGLLATEALGLPLSPELAGTELPGWEGAPFLSTEVGRALELLLPGEDWVTSALFTLRLANDLDEAGLRQFAALLEEDERPYLLTVLGKVAAERGILIPEAYFPLHPLTGMDLPVAPELALSIARRESEFNQYVGSPVGAQGLMQLMPGTAREVAVNQGLDYEYERLTQDWQYNARLGSTYLAGLEEEFGPSPVMIAAGYNAGPSRPRQWMEARGDPRDPEAGVDVVDWIEHIPFTETRNYVQRVAESLPVYQARLGEPQPGPLRFLSLLRGEKPFIRPRSRPTQSELEQLRVRAIEGRATEIAPDVSLRPLARP